MVDSGGVPLSAYRVLYAGRSRIALSHLLERADQLGLRTEVVAAVRALEQSLRSRPLDLGEPVRNLKGLGLQERYGNSSFLFARFAVDAERHLVYVFDFAAIGHDF